MLMVDELVTWKGCAAMYRTGQCRLTASTIEELDAAAEAIGCCPGHFRGRPFPHYLLTCARRAAAIALGAVFLPSVWQEEDRKRA